MAGQVYAKLGRIERITSTGTIPISWSTGGSWPTDAVPKAIMFFGTATTADPPADDTVFANPRHFMGFATANEEFCHAVTGQSSTNLNSMTARVMTRAIVIHQAGTSTNTIQATLQSMDTNGFTLNVTTQDISAGPIYWLALGGPDLTHAKATAVQTVDNTNPIVVDGLGFRPDAVLHTASFFQSDMNDVRTTPTSGMHRFGVMLANGNQWYTGTRTETNSNNNTRSFSNQLCIAIETGTLDAEPFFRASFQSMDADGFTLNVHSGSSNRWILSLALKGGGYRVGHIEQQSSAGNQAISLPGFDPTAALLATFNRPIAEADGTSKADAYFSLGAVGDDLTRHTTLADERGPNVKEHMFGADTLVVFNASSLSPIDAKAVASLGTNEIVLNWDTADNTGAVIGFLAFGGEAVNTVEGIGQAPFRGLGELQHNAFIGGVGRFPFRGLGSIQAITLVEGVGRFPFRGLGEVGELISLVGGVGRFPFRGLGEIEEPPLIVAARMEMSLDANFDLVPTIVAARMPLSLTVRDDFIGRGTGIQTEIDIPLLEMLNEGDTFQIDLPYEGLEGKFGLARLLQFTKSDEDHEGQYDFIAFIDAKLIDELGRPRHTVRLTGSVLRQIRELQRRTR